MIINSILTLCGIILLGLITSLLVLFGIHIALERKQIKRDALNQRLTP